MILTNIMEVRKKVDFFNRIGIHYEAVYHYVVRIRELTAEIYTNDFLDDITAGLISFDMQRFMGNKKYMAEAESWADLLKKALKPHRATLKGLRKKVLQDVPLDEEKLQKQIIRVFEDLSKEGLSVRKSERFDVGASKILHFLIPDLFIILDSNARDQLHKHHEFKKTKKGGTAYLEAMKCYQAELKNWQNRENDLDFTKLLHTDSSWQKFGGARLTPIPRIIDKCTFVGNEYSVSSPNCFNR